MEHPLHRIIQDLYDAQEKKGGLNVKTLKPPTKLIVETRYSFYELNFLEDGKITLFGGTKEGGETRFPAPVDVVFYGSTWGGSLLKADWIGQDMHMEIRIKDTNKMLSTSTVRNVMVEAIDGSWGYSLNWK